MKRRRYTQEDVETVRRCYPTMTYKEISSAYGYSQAWMCRVVKSLDISHDEATWERIKKMKRMTMLEARRHVRNENMSKARKSLWRKERMRVMEGRPQLTRLHFRPTTKRAAMAKYKLMWKYGYIRSDSEPYTLFYDSKTERRLGTRYDEAYYTKKYHIIFKEAEDED